MICERCDCPQLGDSHKWEDCIAALKLARAERDTRLADYEVKSTAREALIQRLTLDQAEAFDEGYACGRNANR
jgi:hypothetical protein